MGSGVVLQTFLLIWCFRFTHKLGNKFYDFSMTVHTIFHDLTLSWPRGEGGGGESPLTLAFSTISPNWIKIMTPKLVNFRQIL